MDYLNEEQYYVDLYDLHTIGECLDYFNSIRDGFIKDRKTAFQKYTDEKFEGEVDKCLSRMLYFIKGERYKRKEETIKEWMDRDSLMQEKYDNTPPPWNIHCKKCGSDTTMTYKDLHNSYEPDARMMFMFECVKCKKRQWIFEDGSEWVHDSPTCPKCSSPLKTSMKNKDEVLTTIYTCSKCSYSKKEVDDFKKSQKEREEKEAHDKELLTKYRSEFVLDNKAGQEYIETAEALKVANVVQKEEAEKYGGPIYERSLQLKKTTIFDLEKLLSETLEKAKYIKLSLGKPEIGQYVSVPFTVQDSDSSRKDGASSFELERLIKDTLENTNWRLLSNSVFYRLGYLEGSLKGYENEEDMLKLAGQKEATKPKPKIDEAMRSKYSSNNLVQLARLMGEFEGVKNMRKRRLLKEPDGFFLNDGNEGYTCGVCHETMSGDKTWWDLKGIRCADCQRNLKAGNVPLEIFDEDYGFDVVISHWDFKDVYGVYPITVKRLKKEGLIKGHDLKREDGSIYYTIYLVSENHDFLKSYPKKDPKMKVEFINPGNGEKIQL